MLFNVKVCYYRRVLNHLTMYTRQELMHRLSDELAKLNTTNANIQSIMDDMLELDAEAYAEAKYQARPKLSWDGSPIRHV